MSVKSVGFVTVEKDLRTLLLFGLLGRSTGSTHVPTPQIPDAFPSFCRARSTLGLQRGAPSPGVVVP